MKLTLTDTVKILAVGLTLYVLALAMMLVCIFLGLKTFVFGIAYFLLGMKAVAFIFVVWWFFKFMFALARSGDKYLDTKE